MNYKDIYKIKKEIKKALKCCAEFLCNECPYQKYDGGTRMPLKCSHKMIVDLYNELKGIDEYD